jgi:hypothetical protein
VRVVTALAAAFAAAQPIAGGGQEADENVAAPAESREPPGAPDIVVTGESRRDLRLRIRKAEDAFFERFNAINSDDRFDIHCRDEIVMNSNFTRRECVSSSWREGIADLGRARLQELRAESTVSEQLIRGEMYLLDDRLRAEMERLVADDAQLKAALLEMASARAALTGGAAPAPSTAVVREVLPASGLPYGAQRAFAVKIGRDSWTHALAHSTFTFAQVDGEIRELGVACDRGDARLDYQADVDWTIPGGWSACDLEVRAKRGTTFILYEF